jgi:Peptidase family S41
MDCGAQIVGQAQSTLNRRHVILVQRCIQAAAMVTVLAGVTARSHAQSNPEREPTPFYQPRPLGQPQVAQEISLVRQALEQVHSGYDRYVPRKWMDTLFAQLTRRAALPMTDVELYRELSLLLGVIRCNHTKAEYPKSLEQFRNRYATHLPLRVRVFGSRLFVDANGAGIARGTEIVSINSVTAAEAVKKLSRFAAIDGFTEFTRASRLESDGDLMGSDLDHFWPIEFGFSSAWTFVLRDATGKERVESHAPITFAAWNALTGDTAQIDFANGTQLRSLDDSTAMLTIRSFVNYRTPINADSLYRSIFARLATQNIAHLILDLRENGGGSSDASSGLIRYLADTVVQPDRTVRRRVLAIDSTLSTFFETWGDRRAMFAPDSARFVTLKDGWFAERRAPERLAPSPTAFRERVSVLVGRQNGSGSTMLLAVLQEIGARTGRLRLVGEETGGSAEGPTAGQVLFLKLPHSQITVRVPLMRTDVNVRRFVPGFGAFPDIDGTQTLSDFRAGLDRALVTARETPWTGDASPLAAAHGVMHGELEYRDYSDGTRTKIPSWVHIAPIGRSGSFRLRTIYDDGPGKTLYSTEVVQIDGDRWIEQSDDAPDTLRIMSRSRTTEGTVFVLRGRGMDDRKAVEFRYTVTVGPSVYRRLKEFREPGKAFAYRHEYRYRRAA